MKTLKSIVSLLVMFFLMASFSQCSTAQKLQKEAPVVFGKVYAQKWVAGVKGGGSGINVFIPVDNTEVAFDSIFFRNQKVKLERSRGEHIIYVGRFRTELNQQEDIILSSDMKEESKNKLPNSFRKENFPFELNDNECVVSYQKGDKTLYYKISNIKIERPMHYPSAPSNRQ